MEIKEMAEIIKCFKEEIPKMRFIGKKYPGFGKWWGEWFANEWFDTIEHAMGGTDAIVKLWENGGGYVGLERRAPEQPFEYWIGMFTPANTEVPEGFEYIDFPATELGTCWIYGSEKEVHRATGGCRDALCKAEIKPWLDDRGGEWSFENCTCPRYTTPDESGRVILDYCYFAQ